MPPRDPNQKPGTAVIRGRVVAADTGTPLRKAQVRAVSPEIRENRLGSTDANGVYEIKELPAGRYNITVNKGSFVTLSYGQLRPFEAGKPLQVGDGQTIEKIDFSLPRGGVVTGRVVDEFGEAIADVQVSAMRYQYQQGRRRLTPAGRTSTTNDIGDYRLFGLAPGQYFLSATMRSGGMAVMDIAVDMNAAGASGDRSGYAPTYYPGTPNAAEAQKVTVGMGQTINDMNMALVPTRLARVSGTAVDSNGKPLAGGMIMSMARSGVTISSMSAGQIRPDGSFTLSNLSPGEYIIQAMVPAAAMDLSDMATAQITVAGEDINGLQLAGQKSVLVTGRILVDPAAAKSLTPATFRPMATAAHPEDNLLAGAGAGKVNDDFTFEVKARPGLALIRFPTMPPGWSLKAVKHNGNDVTDTGLDLQPGQDVSGVEVELTNTPTEISGMVTNSRSEPVKDYTVVVFARDQDRWGYMSRFVQTGRPDQDGRFKVRGLPAGEYNAVAVDYIEAGQATDPEFLDSIKARAVTFKVNDGETKTMDLKLTSPSTP